MPPSRPVALHSGRSRPTGRSSRSVRRGSILSIGSVRLDPVDRKRGLVRVRAVVRLVRVDRLGVLVAVAVVDAVPPHAARGDGRGWLTLALRRPDLCSARVGAERSVLDPASVHVAVAQEHRDRDALAVLELRRGSLRSPRLARLKSTPPHATRSALNASPRGGPAARRCEPAAHSMPGSAANIRTSPSWLTPTA